METKNYESCKKFKALYTREGEGFAKTHLGICAKHAHIGDKNNGCMFWSVRQENGKGALDKA